MCALMTFRNWVLFLIVCAGAAAFFGWQSLPHLPLDSGVDPATLAAYQAAVIAHWIKFAAIGLGIPLLVLIVGRLACGKRPERL
jgi:hypothetical protein